MDTALSIFNMSPYWLILLGFGVGVLSGLLGVGGGVLVTPALHILGLSMHAAVATSLTQMVGGSLSGALKHWRLGNVSLRLVLVLGLPSLLGLVCGRQLLLALPPEHSDTFLSTSYLSLMVYVAFSIVKKMRQESKKILRVQPAWTRFGPKLGLNDGARSLAILPCMLAGILVGFVSSLTGLGGGFLYIPALSLLAASSIKEAIGTSLATVFISSTFGAIIFGSAGESNLPAALLLMIGSIAGAQIGARIAQKAENKFLEGLLLVLVFAAISSMIFKFLHWEILANYLLFSAGISIVLLALISGIKSSAKRKL